MLGTWVGSLVGELRSHMQHSWKKKWACWHRGAIKHVPVIHLVLGRPKELISKEQPHLACPVPLWSSITHSTEDAKDRCCTSNLGGQVISSSFGCPWWKAIVSWVLIRFRRRYSIIGNLMIFSKPLLRPLKMGILTVLALWRVFVRVKWDNDRKMLSTPWSSTQTQWLDGRAPVLTSKKKDTNSLIDVRTNQFWPCFRKERKSISLQNTRSAPQISSCLLGMCDPTE